MKLTALFEARDREEDVFNMTLVGKRIIANGFEAWNPGRIALPGALYFKGKTYKFIKANPKPWQRGMHFMPVIRLTAYPTNKDETMYEATLSGHSPGKLDVGYLRTDIGGDDINYIKVKNKDSVKWLASVTKMLERYKKYIANHEEI